MTISAELWARNQRQSNITPLITRTSYMVWRRFVGCKMENLCVTVQYIQSLMCMVRWEYGQYGYRNRGPSRFECILHVRCSMRTWCACLCVLFMLKSSIYSWRKRHILFRAFFKTKLRDAPRLVLFILMFFLVWNIIAGIVIVNFVEIAGTSPFYVIV